MKSDLSGEELKNKQLGEGGILFRNQNGTEFITFEGEVSAKKCPKCSIWKDRVDYGRNKRFYGGIQSYCKECCKEYRLNNKERNAELVRMWQNRNKGALKRHQVEWRSKHPNYFQDYYDTNKEKILEYNKTWREENSEEYLKSISKYHLRKAKLPHDLTDKERESVLMFFENSCALTGVTEDIHIDHVIPISIGWGGTTHGNVIPLTVTLNSSKHANHIFEWFEANRQRFDLSQERFDRLIGFLAEANEMTTEEYRKYVDWCFDNPRDLTNEEETAS